MKKIEFVIMFFVFAAILFTNWCAIHYTIPVTPVIKTDTTIVIIDGTDYNAAVNYIKQCEGFESKPYQCGGYYFVGYGHLINKMDSNIVYTEYQATELLEYDLQHLIKYVSNLYNLTGAKALAVAMLFYNVSHKSIFSSRLHSELLKPDDKRDYEVIKSNWINLCKYNNKPNQKLIERRKFELRLFLKN